MPVNPFPASSEKWGHPQTTTGKPTPPYTYMHIVSIRNHQRARTASVARTVAKPPPVLVSKQQSDSRPTQGAFPTPRPRLPFPPPHYTLLVPASPHRNAANQTCVHQLAGYHGRVLSSRGREERVDDVAVVIKTMAFGTKPGRNTNHHYTLHHRTAPPPPVPVTPSSSKGG